MTIRECCRKIAVALWGVMIIMFSFGDSIKVANINLSRILFVLLIGVTLVYMISKKKIRIISGEQRDFLLFFAVFWMIYSIVQGLWIVDMTLWLQGMLSTSINIFLIIELWILICENDEINEFFKYICLLWCVNIGLGMYERVTKQYFIHDGISYWDKDMVRTFFVNPNDCATWMVLCYLLFEFFLIRKEKTKILRLGIWGLTLFVVEGTGSRACIYGLYIYAIVYLGAYILQKQKTQYSEKTWYKLFLAVSILVVVVLMVVCFVTDLPNVLVEMFSGVGNKESDLYRLQLISGTIKVIINSYFGGVGANQTIQYLKDNPHNFLGEMFADYGIIIFMGLIYIMVQILSVYFHKQEKLEIRVFYFTYIITFLVISISSSSMNRLRLTWISLALLFLAIRNSDEKCKESNYEFKRII